ncbi:MAG: hypothetical protein A3K10_00080 [Bacteroidetes bacterium RIFCSPLOWO2_12_FULL_31_6]|nr:MAG: hypothetical protein A3K10_00080 [Bacteroidetes bacterium RIFCSPLOWO2_12_FULL_31_6]
MQPILPNYIIDPFNRKVAVQLDVTIYEKMEKIIEDYALGKLLEEELNTEKLNLKEAKVYYKKLKKN